MTKINFNAQNISWTDAMEVYARDAIEKGMSRAALEDMSYTVKLSIVDKKTKLIKVELSGAGFRAQCANKDFYSAMTAVVSKFKSLVLKHTKKRIDSKRKAKGVEQAMEAIAELEAQLSESPVSKEKVFILDPCSIDTAIELFEQTDYNFYTFRDIDTNNEVAILYKRFDGTIGVIRCK
jgi:ribosome-associated translation inhibitor RaiA